jgi:hypothetical protein
MDFEGFWHTSNNIRFWKANADSQVRELANRNSNLCGRSAATSPTRAAGSSADAWIDEAFTPTRLVKSRDGGRNRAAANVGSDRTDPR